ncbi:hypothetical protein [Pontibacter chinhatensis]|uniref:Uncharacterized protein n=1 Tax=Pontibacter chinhatensis TaxID=1436961 RepID=A0A1I2QHY7_9BACT|nr:hypothetical protein [Pontibacter chinhatensis]SFG28022.1 hypothetical protein SAMN05421739_10220 [Pontibacter chinhatensis]
MHLRARVEKDLEELLAQTELTAPVQTWPGADYRYRVIVGADKLPVVFQKLAESIDYDNFKNMIHASPTQQGKYYAYSPVWEIMYQQQQEPEEE